MSLLPKKLPNSVKDEARIQAEWYEKLADEGFVDIEDKKGNLKQYDRRTIAFENREIICEFFVRLDHYLTQNPNIPEPEKSILILYSEGLYATQIQRKLKVDQWSVKRVIRNYKQIILSIFHTNDSECIDNELKLEY